MITRYLRPQMASLWDAKTRYETWLEVELLALEALVREGWVPASALKTIRAQVKINPERIDEIEKVVHHDLVAFVSSLTEQVGEEGRFLHFGMTSSDVVDTALAVLMRKASDHILEGLTSLKQQLREKAETYKQTIMMGRSHGIHGEPITFGLKMLLWYDETQRNIVRMEQAKTAISYGKLSGAMGTFAHLPPKIERYVCKRLGLTPEPVASQIVPRDRHAAYVQTLALIATSLEKFATEIRHLQRTEVLEAEEPFKKGQKGSSAMPHKRNPIGCENICGLARVVRSHAVAAMENIPLWHERDISHSSVERIILPDSTGLLDYMLHRFTGVIENLVVYPDRMAKNMTLTHGVIFSQKVLLELIKKGSSRENAYQAVQTAAMKSLRTTGSFKKALGSDPEVRTHMSREEIDACFDPKGYVAHLDETYRRVLGAYS